MIPVAAATGIIGFVFPCACARDISPAPTFQTLAPKYAWLKSVQAIDKVVELKLGEGGYVRYDIFVVH